MSTPSERHEEHIADRGRPYNGAEFLASLRDGRAVYIAGERVADVTAHASLRNCARSTAALYDALHDPAKRDLLTCPTDLTGSDGGGYTHRSFRVSRSREELMRTRDAIAGWARMSYGWLGRTPDYKASFTTTLGANAEFYGPFAENARRWYAMSQRTVPFMNHAIVNPPIDRARPVHECRDVCVHVERETDAGIIVSGAKVVATSAALTHYNFVGQTPATVSDDLDMALAFIVPMNAGGLKLICRNSYEGQAVRNGTPFDYPLSSRFDENDAILVLDKVFVPWENVLIYRDPERVRAFFEGSGFLNGFLFQGCTRFAVKLEFLAGLLSRALQATGGNELRSNQVLLGEVIAWSHLFWSLSTAMASSPEAWVGDAVLPERRAALAYNVFAGQCYSRVREIIMQTVSSGLIYLPSSARDLDNPEVASVLERYVRGSNGVGHVERIKIMKLLWDAVGTEFAGRHELYERTYSGGWEGVRYQAAGEAARSGRLDTMHALVEQCLSEYDQHGWTGDTWCGSPGGGAGEAEPKGLAA